MELSVIRREWGLYNIMKGKKMWILIVWTLTMHGLVPESTMIAINQEDCSRMQQFINDRSILLPSSIASATCVYTDMPASLPAVPRF